MLRAIGEDPEFKAELVKSRMITEEQAQKITEMHAEQRAVLSKLDDVDTELQARLAEADEGTPDGVTIESVKQERIKAADEKISTAKTRLDELESSAKKADEEGPSQPTAKEVAAKQEIDNLKAQREAVAKEAEGASTAKEAKEASKKLPLLRKRFKQNKLN